MAAAIDSTLNFLDYHMSFTYWITEINGIVSSYLMNRFQLLHIMFIDINIFIPFFVTVLYSSTTMGKLIKYWFVIWSIRGLMMSGSIR